MQLPTHWRTRNGQMLRIRDMSDSHLLNAIWMLERKAEGMGRQLGMALFCKQLLNEISRVRCGPVNDEIMWGLNDCEDQLEPWVISRQEVLKDWPKYLALMDEAKFRSEAAEFQARRGEPT